jgi:thiol-disulfide isomerase/thioredoxin
MSHRLTFATVVVALAAAVTAVPSAQGTKPEPACDANAKRLKYDFMLKNVEGKPVRLDTYAGKVVLFDFWATWCGPCKLEIPGFSELYSRYRANGFEVVGLITEDPISNVPAFAREIGMNYTVLDANGREDVEDAFGTISGLPTSFLVSRDGRICKTHTGYASKAEFEREVNALLAMAPPAPAPGRKAP